MKVIKVYGFARFLLFLKNWFVSNIIGSLVNRIINAVNGLKKQRIIAMIALSIATLQATR
ncbi:MAG: hypothetical protein WDO19_00685 [Bacteroidota bacterium]